MTVEPARRGAGRPDVGELLVSEIFGPTLQGEGPSAGQAAAFVRLGGCNMACRWCDTPYTWDRSRYGLSRELTIRCTDDVARQVLSLGPRLVVITGGEPALQAPEATRLARTVAAAGGRVEVETSGTLPLGELTATSALVVVSPKLARSGMSSQARLRWAVLDELADLPNSAFTFVVGDPVELAEVQGIAVRLALSPARTWIMPEAIGTGDLLQRMRALAGPVAERGWSLGGRLQVLLWESERGH